MIKSTIKTVLSNYIDTNINTNNAQSITGAIMNTFLKDFLEAIESSMVRATTPPTLDTDKRFWYDLTVDVLKVRNAANNDWVTIGGLTGKVLDLGNGCIVEVLGNTTLGDWSYTKANGQGTIIIPANSFIMSGTVRGTSTDANYADGNYVQAFRLNFRNTTGGFNTNYATALIRKTSIIDATNQGQINVNTPMVFDAGLVQKSICGISNNEVCLGFNRISQFYTGGWMINF